MKFFHFFHWLFDKFRNKFVVVKFILVHFILIISIINLCLTQFLIVTNITSLMWNFNALQIFFMHHIISMKIFSNSTNFRLGFWWIYTFYCVKNPKIKTSVSFYLLSLFVTVLMYFCLVCIDYVFRKKSLQRNHTNFTI